MNQATARAVSIAGHPMLALPLAVVAIAAARGQWRAAGVCALGFAAFAALVMGYSRWQVKLGRWGHVDASDRGERRDLNRFLLVALLVGTALAAFAGPSRELVVGLALSTAMVAFAMATARWWKLSLHMAFVVFAAWLLFSVSTWAGALALAFAAMVAWSRLSLRRHVPRDLVAGAATGCVAGLVFLWSGVATG